jgi:hypothetical protein
MSRQINGCANDVSEYLTGTKGRAHLAPAQYRFEGVETPRIRGRDEVNPYVQEHINLLRSISENQPINELKQVAESTLVAIMGRMSAFTGKAVTWEQAMNSRLDTFPKELAWGPLPVDALPIPGQTELI